MLYYGNAKHHRLKFPFPPPSPTLPSLLHSLFLIMHFLTFHSLAPLICISPPEGRWSANTLELTAGESLFTGFTQRIVDSGRIRAFEKLAENTNIAQHSREGYHYRRKRVKMKEKTTVESVKQFRKNARLSHLCVHVLEGWVCFWNQRNQLMKAVRWPTDQWLHDIRKHTDTAMFCFPAIYCDAGKKKHSIKKKKPRIALFGENEYF